MGSKMGDYTIQNRNAPPWHHHEDITLTKVSDTAVMLCENTVRRLCNKQRYKRNRRQVIPRYIRGTPSGSVVLSDGSVLRYVMSQGQADTQNTKSNIPPVWKTVGINRRGHNTCNTSTPQSLCNKNLRKCNTPQSLREEKKITTEKCGITRARQILHGAYAKTNYDKKKLSQKRTL